MRDGEITLVLNKIRLKNTRPPLSPPRPPPSHMHAGWMVSATKTPTSSATSQDSPF
jgi:hypothetical protein